MEFFVLFIVSVFEWIGVFNLVEIFNSVLFEYRILLVLCI